MNPGEIDSKIVVRAEYSTGCISVPKIRQAIYEFLWFANLYADTYNHPSRRIGVVG